MDDHGSATATTGSAPVASPRSPRRVLVVSANMGGGHHATAAALEESAGRIWPASEILRIDALDAMGGWVGDAFRRTYVSNVESTPWLYEFFYSSLWRHRWFAQASKRFVGSWCGRRLIRHIDAFDPDMVLSTYPLGTAGLAWLIRHRALAVPVGNWVSDFAPHPFWVYREVAVNYLVDHAAVAAARSAEPGGRYQVSALPVTQRFQPVDRTAARRELNLRADALVVLIGCGSYAFGDVVSLVRTVADVSEDVQVVAACGRNDEIRSQIDALGLPADRVTTLGWTERMPDLTAAADVVIGNAGGATALEAMACKVPLILTEPIAAHGAANADLMAVAGAAELCRDRASLAAYLHTLVDRRATSADPAAAPVSAAPPAPVIVTSPTPQPVPQDTPVAVTPDGPPRGADSDRVTALDETVTAVATAANNERSPRYSSWPMRPSDAFFCHVESTGAAQELGVVLELGPGPRGEIPTVESIRTHLQQRTCLPSTRRLLVREQPGWRLATDVDVADHVDEVVTATADRSEAWKAAGDFFVERLPAGRAAWQMRLIRGWSGDGALFAIKMHHSQADGISALGLLDRLLDAGEGDPLPERRRLAGDGGVPARVPLSTIGRGLVALASRGFAPTHPLGNVRPSAGRQLVAASVRWPAVRALARRAEASVTEAAISIGAHVLQRILVPSGLLRPGVPLRAMVPVAMRAARLDREFGNWTGSVAADLDMADRSIVDRVHAVRDELRRRHHAGEAPAAAAVMGLAGRLPTPVHRAFTRAVYQRRFFGTVVSFMPGARRGRWLAGAPVTGMTPVLPLPPRVPVTVGMIVTAGRLDVGVVLDRHLSLGGDGVQRAVADALAEVG